jgi:uncharacterized membrane-anchored protein YhcB (DUF1043 family)
LYNSQDIFFLFFDFIMSAYPGSVSAFGKSHSPYLSRVEHHDSVSSNNLDGGEVWNDDSAFPDGHRNADPATGVRRQFRQDEASFAEFRRDALLTKLLDTVSQLASEMQSVKLQLVDLKLGVTDDMRCIKKQLSHVESGVCGNKLDSIALKLDVRAESKKIQSVVMKHDIKMHNTIEALTRDVEQLQTSASHHQEVNQSALEVVRSVVEQYRTDVARHQTDTQSSLESICRNVTDIKQVSSRQAEESTLIRQSLETLSCDFQQAQEDAAQQREEIKSDLECLCSEVKEIRLQGEMTQLLLSVVPLPNVV